jgi:hypothetical protein
MNRLFLFAVAFLAGCASHSTCEYEAKKAVASHSSSDGPGMSGAIAAGIDEGMKLGELQYMCMQLHGYSR